MTYRAIDFKVKKENGLDINWREYVWGTDIFINGVPLIKCLIVGNIIANIIIWLIFIR